MYPKLISFYREKTFPLELHSVFLLKLTKDLGTGTFLVTMTLTVQWYNIYCEQVCMHSVIKSNAVVDKQ